MLGFLYSSMLGNLGIVSGDAVRITEGDKKPER